MMYNLQLEKAVLGMCVLFNAFGVVYGELDELTFHYEDNRKVFKALKKLYDAGAPINIRTVAFEMDIPDPEYYLSTLENNITNPASLDYEAKLLKKLWRKREVQRLTSAGTDINEDERLTIRQLTQQLNEIQGTEFKKDWYTMDELMFNLIKHQEEIKNGAMPFVTTGFQGIDRENGGFSSGQLVVIGARPSVGKSALMGKMALSMAKAGKKVGIVSLEMANNEVAGRLASLDTDIDFATIYRNLFQDERENERFYNIVAKSTAHLPIFVSDKTKVDVNDIRAKATKLRFTYGLDCLMVDYLQLVDGSSDNKNYNREQEVSKISRGLKLLAMEMQIPVIVLCQLNRGTTQAKDAAHSRPQLHHLRESGAIEQDADVVMMLHSDFKAGFEVNPDTGGSTEREADLLGLKWRNGATFHLPLQFDPPKMKFSEAPRFIPLKQTKEENPF